MSTPKPETTPSNNGRLRSSFVIAWSIGLTGILLGVLVFVTYYDPVAPTATPDPAVAVDTLQLEE